MADNGRLTNEYCRLLGVSPGADAGEIRRRARKLFLKYHPDLNPGDRARCEEMTKRIIHAYKALLEVKKREAAGGGGVQEERGEAEEEESTFGVLVFMLSNRALGVPSGIVREVVLVRDVKIDDIGAASDEFNCLDGVFYRGSEIVMLWNLYRRLGLRDAPVMSDMGKRKIVVVEYDDSAVGFLVDEIRGIVELGRESLAKGGEEMEIFGEFLEGVAETEDGPVGILDMGKII